MLHDILSGVGVHFLFSLFEEEEVGSISGILLVDTEARSNFISYYLVLLLVHLKTSVKHSSNFLHHVFLDNLEQIPLDVPQSLFVFVLEVI